MDRVFYILGSLLAASGVAAGAFGAHSLRARLAPEMLAVFETGVRYQLIHSPGPPGRWLGRNPLVRIRRLRRGLVLPGGEPLVLGEPVRLGPGGQSGPRGHHPPGRRGLHSRLAGPGLGRLAWKMTVAGPERRSHVPPRPGRRPAAAPPRPRRLRLLKAGFIALVGFYGIACAVSPTTYRFLDRVDLVFHEAGHVIFGLFGEYLGILGGSLMQVLIPALVVGSFFRSQQRYSAAVTLFWVAQSLFNVSVYAKDARAQVLPLLGGEDVLHDWHYLLGRLNLLAWDQAVGNLIYLLGLLTLVASILGGLYFSLEDSRAAEET